MESPEHSPEELTAEQAAEDLDPERGPLENDGDPDREPGEDTPEVPVRSDLDEDLEDRGRRLRNLSSQGRLAGRVSGAESRASPRGSRAGRSSCGTWPQFSSTWRAEASALSTWRRKPTGTSVSLRPHTNSESGPSEARRVQKPSSPWGSSR